MSGAIGCLAYFTNRGAQFGWHAPERLAGVTAVSSAYFVLYGAFRLREGLVKDQHYRLLKKGEADAKSEALVNNAKRTAGNAHEQQGPFMAALWSYGVLVNPSRAAILGTVSIGLLVLYPILFGEGFNQKVLISTIPRYWINMYMMLSIPVVAYLGH